MLAYVTFCRGAELQSLALEMRRMGLESSESLDQAAHSRSLTRAFAAHLNSICI